MVAETFSPIVWMAPSTETAVDLRRASGISSSSRMRDRCWLALAPNPLPVQASNNLVSPGTPRIITDDHLRGDVYK